MSRIDELVIVGGGTAGWLGAVYLSTFLNRLNPDAPPVRIRLIEAPGIPSIGVGESTLPIMPTLLQQLQIGEREFIRKTNATFKCAGRFVDWNRDNAGRPVTFLTPFNGGENIGGFPPSYYYQHYGAENACSMVDAISPNQCLIENYKAPRELHMQDYQMVIGYAYHLDAALFSQQLKTIAIDRGVEYIADEVEQVVLDEQGFVSALKLHERGEIPVRFVIDCSGFKGIVIKQALQEPFIGYDRYFLCDRAYPVMIDYDNPQQIMPATTATALSAGWMWNVPLYTRQGTGYVYSSRFIDDERAQQELMQALGNPEPLNQPRVIPFQVGVTRRAWVKNCLGVGLSTGFVEPLEATAIGMFEKLFRWFSFYYPSDPRAPEAAAQVNRLIRSAQEETRDFIFMHYYLSNREDTPFWRAVRHELEVPDTLQEKLALWQQALPYPDSTLGHQMFDWENYLFALHGKGYFNGRHYNLGDCLDRNKWLQYLRYIEGIKKGMLQRLPSHYELLTRLRQVA